MEFVRGNKAILNHVEDGRNLFLFEYVESGHVRFVGQMVCTGYPRRNGTLFSISDCSGLIPEVTANADIVRLVKK